MPKKILRGAEARQALLRGVNQLADSVSATLGPGGRLVAIEQERGFPPFVTKDGVTVAREIDLPDPFEQIGARLVREAASRTVQTVGDGTTTATVLARALFSAAVKRIDAGGESPQRIRRDLAAAGEAAIAAIRAQATPCAPEDVSRVATVSANGDERIGALVAEAVNAVGEEGVITVEESREFDDKITLTHGLQFDSGYVTPAFVTNPQNSPRMEVHLTSPKGVLVLITNQELRFIKDWQPICEYALYRSMPLLIIADDYGSEATGSECIGTLVQAAHAGHLQSCCIRIPRARFQTEFALVEDVCAVTGAPWLGTETGLSTQKIAQSMPQEGDDGETAQQKSAATLTRYFGVVQSVTIGKSSTVIRALPSRSEAIEGQASRLRAQIAASDMGHVKDGLKRRLARLVSGVATIKVGGATEAERRERKDLFEDAMFAARAAVAGGIVPGGGVALIDAAEAVEDDLLRNAMYEPARKILQNAGFDDRNIGGFGHGLGWDVRAMKEPQSPLMELCRGDGLQQMLTSGIIDPANVVIEALRAAVSIACALLSIEDVVTIIPEVKHAD